MKKSETEHWVDAVNLWFDRNYIASAKVISANQVLLIAGQEFGPPGNVSFGFHFSRDVIPVTGELPSTIRFELELVHVRGQEFLLSFEDWGKLSRGAQSVFETILMRAGLG